MHGRVYGKLLRYTKTIIFLVKCLKVVAKCCLNGILFHGTFYCCLKYSKPIIKIIAQKVWLNLVLDVDFMTLKKIKLDFLFIFIEFITNLKATLQNLVEKHQFYVILSYFKQLLDNYMFKTPTCTLLAPSSRICIFFPT